MIFGYIYFPHCVLVVGGGVWHIYQHKVFIFWMVKQKRSPHSYTLHIWLVPSRVHIQCTRNTTLSKV